MAGQTESAQFDESHRPNIQVLVEAFFMAAAGGRMMTPARGAQ
jgi:hypothetical protein